MKNRFQLPLLIGLILTSALVYLAGNGRVGLWDRDEPRYAQTSRQMLQSGDWVVPHYLDKTRTAKPALIYWCQAAAMEVFGDNEFAARFPSAIATMLLLITLAMVLWRPLGSEMTLWTLFIFATSGLTIAAAKMCITDAVLLLWVTIGQVCIYAIWRGNRSWFVVITLSVMIGLGGLTKGPVILGMEATTLIALAFLGWVENVNRERSRSRGFAVVVQPAAGLSQPIKPSDSEAASIRPSSGAILLKLLVGTAIAIAIFLPWVLMVNHRAAGFVKTAVGHEVWDRMMTPLEQHVGPPGYYFLTIWLTFFPWSLLLPMTIGLAIRRLAEPRIRFALAAIIGPWIMLECVRTKLPHYFLPVFPPLAFLTAGVLIDCIHGRIKDLELNRFLIPMGIWAFLVALAASGPWLIIRAPLPMPIASMIALSVLGIVFGAVVFTAFKTRHTSLAVIIMGLGTFAFIGVLYLWYLPNTPYLRLSERVAAVLIEHHVTQPNQVIMLEYMEPSLAFAQGGTIREAGDIGFSHKFEPLMPPWLVINKEKIWDKAPADLKNDFDVIDQEFGLDYADHGRWITVMILHRKSS